jgi:Tfp pilus assembly PilM family ATPase
LCGGGANLKGLDVIIYEATAIEVVIGDVFVNLGDKNEEVINALTEFYKYKVKSNNKKTKDIFKDKNTQYQDMSFSFVTAIGLALRGIFINEL